MKFGDIEDRGAIVSLVRYAIVFPAYSEVQSQGGIDFPFVLEIGHVECAAQLMATPGSKCRKFRKDLRSQNPD